MYDAELVSDLEQGFRRDLLDSRELLTEDYARRPFHKKLFESAARLLSPLL
jgi:cardiolipin synthase